MNKNGRCVPGLCEDKKLVIVNNLKHGGNHFKSNLSFRKKANWISEPDIFITSESCVQHIASFNMLQRFNGKLLFSDHALVDVAMNLEHMKIPADLLRMRANNLGRSVYESAPIRIEKSLRLSQCDEESMKQYFIDNMPPVILANESVDSLLNQLDRIVTGALKENKVETHAHHPRGEMQNVGKGY